MRCTLWVLGLLMVRSVPHRSNIGLQSIKAPPLGRQHLTKFDLLCKGLFGFQLADILSQSPPVTTMLVLCFWQLGAAAFDPSFAAHASCVGYGSSSTANKNTQLPVYLHQPCPVSVAAQTFEQTFLASRPAFPSCPDCSPPHAAMMYSTTASNAECLQALGRQHSCNRQALPRRSLQGVASTVRVYRRIYSHRLFVYHTVVSNAQSR